MVRTHVQSKSPLPVVAAPRRVLVVSPHFPPVNAPDHQRIRTALPHLVALGWQAEVLVVDPTRVNHPQDPLLAATLPPELAVHTTSAWAPRLGLGNLGWRCLTAMAQAGNTLLAGGKFDLVFFSTTIFPVLVLGPYWQRRFGVPYVVDFQDPWRVGAAPPGQHRPGGRLKYALDKALAAQLEPRVMRNVNQVVVVSAAYGDTLHQRYPWLRPDQITVLPFGAPEADFAALPHLPVAQSQFDPADGHRHWVYVGRGGPDMALALEGLFLALARLRQRCPDLVNALRLHFIGTSYAPAGRAVPSVAPIAAACGVADLVQEQPQRVPYFQAQRLLVDSSAVLLMGSTDPAYTASKLYPAVLARRPLLAVFHRASSVVDILRRTQAGTVVTFDGTTRPTALATTLEPTLEQLLAAPVTAPPTRWDAFAPHTAAAMTRTLVQVFNRCLPPPPPLP